jgi:hypothetical protein
MKTLDDWWTEAAAELGVEAGVSQDLLLDLARDVAHAVTRPAAPLTTYLLGLAVAGGADPADAAAKLVRLSATWT